MKDYGERLDAERRRKRDAILQILFDEAAAGHCYTANQFAEAFEGKAGLGGERTIRERISASCPPRDTSSISATRRTMACHRAAAPSSATSASRAWSCGRPTAIQTLPPANCRCVSYAVLPTHYKCPHSGAAMPVENPDVWVYHDELNDPEAP
jgi:putative DNA primase/helicase